MKSLLIIEYFALHTQYLDLYNNYLVLYNNYLVLNLERRVEKDYLLQKPTLMILNNL